MESVILLLGGNLDDREAILTRATELIGEIDGVTVVKSSSMMESAPWGFGDEVVPPFLNLALECECACEAEELLDATQRIELELGRRRTNSGGYSSRRIDIDLIFYGERVVDTPRLTIPHPLLQERVFALEPIVEIAATRRHPIMQLSCQELLDRLTREDNA